MTTTHRAPSQMTEQEWQAFVAEARQRLAEWQRRRRGQLELHPALTAPSAKACA
ncbi:hypothetical protein [Deinococcus hopiensis]|uniref:Uncharacterized protein n=1 Tax=Deinococcus hopiensis KR-140 TaxID=695939 RepID=A0A1W1UNA2_9DEIO|nr:hypothetical protein [Deinococcus hopiensis]SMB82572.1 hypothetical protein SAMN00790413_04068 [Deinococcus hopiensis KR-140]